MRGRVVLWAVAMTDTAVDPDAADTLPIWWAAWHGMHMVQRSDAWCERIKLAHDSVDAFRNACVLSWRSVQDEALPSAIL